MKSIDLIRWALQFSEQATTHLIDAMADAPLTQPTPGGKGGGGNHPIWILGHLCVIEGGIPHILLGEPNPVENWKLLFATGTQPLLDAGAYPPFDELLRTFRVLRANTVKLLDQLGEEGLDRVPVAVPHGFENVMKTCGQTLLLIALHNMGHYGQIADARRAAGLKPLI